MSDPIELIKSVIPKRLSDEQFDKILTGPPHPVFIVDELRLRSDRAALRAENERLRKVVAAVEDARMYWAKVDQALDAMEEKHGQAE